APASQGYTWLFNGNAIPGEIAQSITAVASGSYAVVANFGTNCQLLSEAVNVISTGLDGPAGSDIKVHPVPANDRLLIDGLTEAQVRISIIDLSGRVVLDQDTKRMEGQVTLDIRDIANGNYVLRITTDQGVELMRRSVAVQR
ncbi:MAG: T9SS type A sorting domain-containing protein, partial [Flavobacteriales bacterium]